MIGTPKVLLLIDRLGLGGAAQVVLNTALALNRERFSPVVCTTHKAPACNQDNLLRQAGVPLIELDRRSRWQLQSWLPLWRVLPTVTILHSHESGSNLWGRFWGRLFRVPIIITQDHTAADVKPRIVHLVDRVMSPLSDRIVTVSQFNRELTLRVEKIPSDKVVTICNGIDTDRFAGEPSRRDARRRAGLPEDKWLLAVVGTLRAEKNHQGLFEALTLIPEDMRSKSHCLVVGSNPYERFESQLRSEVHRLGLQEIVSFLGQRSDVPTILSAIDLFVLPSYTECSPMVLMEALAARCPVVATTVGGVPEVLNGLGWPLVSPGDSSSLADAIVNVLQMPVEERNRMAEVGRQTVVEKFSKEASVAQVEQLYHSLLASSSGRTFQHGGGPG